MAQKVLKILFILFILLSICINYIYATDIDMDLPNNNSNVFDSSENTNQNIENTITDTNSENTANTLENIADSITDDDASLPSAETLSPSVISTSQESGLSTTNIINILLITVGVIIILLAIAIIIRLNSNF